MEEKEMQNINLATSTVELSEYNTYILLRNEMCFYNEPNRNGVGLKYDGRAYDRALTLVGMPVYAKYIKRMGKDDLGGHENYIDPRTGEMLFDTEAIGVHTSVEIASKETNVNGVVKSVPCLYSTLKIWKRNKNFVNAIKRLHTLGKLSSSYEIRSYSSKEEDGVRWLTEYEFEGNALLGTGHIPAYSNANLEVLCAEQESNEIEMLVAEALATDLKGKEGTEMDEKEKIESTETEEVEETKSVEEQVAEDVEYEVAEPANDTTDEPDKDGEEVKESEGTAEESENTEDEGKETDDEKTEEPKPEDDDKDEVATCKDTEENKEEEIKKLQSALVKATQSIATLTAEVESMKEAVDKYNAIMAEIAEAEKAEARNNLKAYAEKSGLFTSDEFDNPESEIAKFIADLDEDGVKKIISDKYIASLSQKETKAEAVVSEAKADAHIDVTSSEFLLSGADGKDIISTYIKSKKRK